MNLRLDLYAINCHAQEYMKEHGITYQHATPQSMADSWWFWNCENVPAELPASLSVLTIAPHKAIGWGLTKEIADSLAAQVADKPQGQPE